MNGVDRKLLNRRNLWGCQEEWDKSAESLAKKFINNFENFTDNDEGKRLVSAGPQLK